MEYTDKVQKIAKICHEANKALCAAFGDFSQLSWEEAPDWQKESACNGVIYHLSNPITTPASSHENWLKEKLNTGWKYGPVKDVDKKEHPCCVPYNELPISDQCKDYIFHAICHAMDSVLSDNTH